MYIKNSIKGNCVSFAHKNNFNNKTRITNVKNITNENGMSNEKLTIILA